MVAGVFRVFARIFLVHFVVDKVLLCDLDGYHHRYAVFKGLKISACGYAVARVF